MCPVEDAYSNYCHAAIRVFELLEGDPDPVVLDAAFERARRYQAEWAGLWEGHAA